MNDTVLCDLNYYTDSPESCVTCETLAVMKGTHCGFCQLPSVCEPRSCWWPCI